MSPLTRTLLFAITLSTLLSCSEEFNDRTTSDDTVQVENGELRGTFFNGVKIYKGIPYARPPIGPLRWKAPENPQAWKGVYNADKFGHQCAQVGLTDANFKGNEDCLTLNIWSPTHNSAKLLPVFVNLHGGANLTGSGTSIDFTQFSKAGTIIVISINYRLGPFGFLAHPDLANEDPNHSTGNYGILDQIAALKWIQRNVQQFGGDPSRVTIGGQSAGAIDSSVLVASPLAANLFSAAILMSGTWVVQPANVLENTALVATKYLGCDTAIDVTNCLRNKSTIEVASVPGNGTSNLDAYPTCATIGCRYNLASVDGYVLPLTSRQIVRNGNHNKVPMIIGTTAHEWTTIFYVLGQVMNSEADYLNTLKLQFTTTKADAIYNLYPSNDFPQSGQYTSQSAAYIIAMGDIFHHCPIKNMLDELNASQNSPVWQYVSAHERGFPLLAGHGTDIPYFLLNYKNFNEAERTLASVMSGHLIRFIQSHDTGSDLSSWPAYDQADSFYRIFETPSIVPANVQVQSQWRHSQCELLEQSGFDWEIFPVKQ